MASAYIGNIVHTLGLDNFQIISNGFVAVNENGMIVGVGTDFDAWIIVQNASFKEIRLTKDQFLMPGFVDCHIHAPQFAQIGLGLDMPLLNWLNTYTFPLEAKFSDQQFAQQVYEKVVEATIRCGTTLASYFATIDKDSTLILAREAKRQGQRALVGKVCSNCNSPSYYVEQTDESVEATTDFIEAMKCLDTSLVRPTITPRFALSCSKELLEELGKIASAHDIHIQSHISESVPEIELVTQIFSNSYTNAYDEAGLLTKKTILAHGVHLEDEEIALLSKRGTSVAHCPASNTMLNSGLCDVQRLIKGGVKVGLGTDVSGGNSVSIKDTMLRTLEVSKHLEFINKQDIKGTGRIQSPKQDYKQLNYKQVFYLATLGGAEALALDNLTGNFVIGKDFDALIISAGFNTLIYRDFSIEELVEKFIFNGDDRNISAVYVAGHCIKRINVQCSNCVCT